MADAPAVSPFSKDEHMLTVSVQDVATALAQLDRVGAGWSYQERAAYLISALSANR